LGGLPHIKPLSTICGKFFFYALFLNTGFESKEILLATLQQKDMQWIFEVFKKNLSIPAEELIFALKSCIQEQCVEEELATDSGEWFYVWQASQKITERPKSLDERLQDINNNY
jgi:hypothetical protein